MAASNFQRQEIQENLGGNGTQCKLGKSGNVHQESFVTIDLNRPKLESALNESSDRLCFLRHATNIYDNKKELERALRRATNKRRYLERELSLSKKISNLDLSLKLSPPGTNSKDEPSSGSSSRASCVSTDMNPDEPPPPPPNVALLEEEPNSVSLILMGCQKCLIYVMVPENDPNCPKCKSDGLLDMFRGGPTKKTRTN